MKLPSNLRPTTRESVRLVSVVTAGHVTKMASYHSIRRIRKPHAAPKPHGSRLYRTGVMATEFYIAGIGILDFCSCDFDLYPMPFIYTLNPYSPERHIGCAKMNFVLKVYES